MADQVYMVGPDLGVFHATPKVKYYTNSVLAYSLYSSHPMKSPEQIDPDWARYAETILRFTAGGNLEVDLRESLSDQMRAEFKGLGFRDTFGIVTAHDPYGRDLAPEENRQLQVRLESELQASDIHFVPVDACSLDRKHCECSVAIDVDQATAVSIARKYEQMAIFWYDGEAMWLIGAMVESDPIRLPRTA